MTKTMINLIVSVVFAVITAGAFFWLWTTATSEDTTGTPTAAAQTYQTVEIESVKKQATEILSGLEKNTDIPVGVPTSKMGRTNPFVSP